MNFHQIIVHSNADIYLEIYSNYIKCCEYNISKGQKICFCVPCGKLQIKASTKGDLTPTSISRFINIDKNTSCCIGVNFYFEKIVSSNTFYLRDYYYNIPVKNAVLKFRQK